MTRQQCEIATTALEIIRGGAHSRAGTAITVFRRQSVSLKEDPPLLPDSP